MIATVQWIKMAYLTFSPMVILALNVFNFIARGKSRRGRLFYLEQRTPKDYVVVHWLLILGFTLLILSWLWKPASPALHVSMATWFMWINIHAMISRRRKQQQLC